MKKAFKIAVVSILAQAALSAAAGAEEARPVAVDILVEAGSGDLSEKAAAISEALLSGDSAGADRLLSDLYSGAVQKEGAAPAAPVRSRCGCQHAAAPSVTVPAGQEGQVPGSVTQPADVQPETEVSVEDRVAAQMATIAYHESIAAEKKKKDAEAAKEDTAAAKKAFQIGMTIMVAALFLLLLL